MSDDPAGPKDWQKEQKGKAKDAYQKSAEGRKQEEKPKEPRREQGVDDLIKDHKPGPILAPDGSLRSVVDRTMARHKLSKARAAAREADKQQNPHNRVLESYREREREAEQEKARENPGDKLKSDYNKSADDRGGRGKVRQAVSFFNQRYIDKTFPDHCGTKEFIIAASAAGRRSRSGAST